MIGVHLIIDGVLSLRTNGEEIERVLLELPGKIGMKILAGPFIVKGKNENPGWTGFVVIDKSHIVIHSFDEGDKISIDVYSCKVFKKEHVLSYLKEHFNFKKLNVKMLSRSED